MLVTIETLRTYSVKRNQPRVNNCSDSMALILRQPISIHEICFACLVLLKYFADICILPIIVGI